MKKNLIKIIIKKYKQNFTLHVSYYAENYENKNHVPHLYISLINPFTAIRFS
jgi:hypothetical protein